jgi:excisionase family DNA binding protein
VGDRAKTELPQVRLMGTDLPQLLDIEGLAGKLATSVRHVRRLVAERRIPYLKVGHLVRFDPEEVLHWLGDHRMTPTRHGARTTCPAAGSTAGGRPKGQGFGPIREPGR